MLLLFSWILLFGTGCCVDDAISEMKTVDVGANVTLECPRDPSVHKAILVWTRIVSGRLPEVFRATFAFDFTGVGNTNHITTKQTPKKFVLEVNEATQNDGGIYFCIQIVTLDATLLRSIFLRVRGSQPDKVAVIQVPPSDQVRSLTLQCSVLSDSVSNTCSGGPSVCWFTAGSSESSLGVLYTPGYTDGECESTSEGRAAQECVQNPSTEINSSHEGSYSCVVAACGRIMFGDFTFQSQGNCSSKTALVLLSFSLVFSLVLNSYLIYVKKKQNCGNNRENIDRQNQMRDDGSVIYAAPSFTEPKPGKRRNLEGDVQEIIYSDVKTSEVK